MGTEVLPAVGRFADFATVVGTRRPDAGGCWCTSYRDSRVPTAERAAFMRQECDADPGPGVLAYVDGEVAGWCSVAPRGSYRRLTRSRTLPWLPGPEPWSVVCFVVRPGYRGRGLMHDLLAGAVAHAAAHGAEVVEGYPIERGETKVDVISGYVGAVEQFERAGFHRAAATTGHSGHRPRWLMRLELGSAAPR